MPDLWIDPGDVTAVYPDVDPSVALVAHVQRLATGVVGTQTTPPDALKGVMVEIVRRFAAAAADDPNVQQQALGAWSQTRRVGLGLTDREEKALHKSVGRSNVRTVAVYSADQLEVQMVDVEGQPEAPLPVDTP